MKNNYIATYYNKYKNRIQSWEKTSDNKRVYKEYKPQYYFYIPDANGEFITITDEKVSKITFDSKEEFEQGCREYRVKFESDLSVHERCMMDNFVGLEPPELIIGYIDIETDYDPTRNFSGAENAYAAINAITLYRSDIDDYLTFAVPSKKFKHYKTPQNLPNLVLVETEEELLELFLESIVDVDVLSGWNSEFFDLPYIGKRIEMSLGKLHLRRLGFEGAPEPKWSEAKRFKFSDTTELVLDIRSRVHLDYMKLFKKFNLGGRESFSLAAIADEELDIPKMKYDGSLHDLYNNDFENFVRYNIRDVEIIKKLNDKFKYIELANSMVHEGTVNFEKIFGSVALIDSAIINFAHLKLNKIVCDKSSKAPEQVEGAMVLTPKPGFYKSIASVDIKSLYPSTFRSLNLSPEMILGQFLGYESDWNTLYQVNIGNKELENKTLRLQLENSDEIVEQTAKEFLIYFKQSKIVVTGYGTIIDQSRGMGLIPSVLTYWFNDRVEKQKEKKKYAKLAQEILDNGIHIDDLRL